MAEKTERGKGRPLKLTPELQSAICDTIRQGNFRDVAARAAGVSVRALRDWLAKGRQQTKGVYADFLHAVIEAEQAAEIKMVRAITDAAPNDPKNAQWWLERKFPDRWGKDTSEISKLKRLVTELEARLNGQQTPQAHQAGGSFAGGQGPGAGPAAVLAAEPGAADAGPVLPG